MELTIKADADNLREKAEERQLVTCGDSNQRTSLGGNHIRAALHAFDLPLIKQIIARYNTYKNSKVCHMMI